MRKLCAFAVPFSAAVLAAVYLLPARALLPLAGTCALSALTCFFWRGDGRLRAALIGLGLAAGLLWTGLYGRLWVAPALALEGHTAPVEAAVIDWPRQTDRGCAVTARIGGIKTRLLLDGDYADLKPGDTLSGVASLRRSDVVRGETRLANFAKGIYLIAYARGPWTVSACPEIPLRHFPAVTARAVQDSVATCFGADTAPFLTALLTGEKSGLPGALYHDFQRTGIAHVVAVSGMHVSFLAGLITTLLGRHRRRSAAVGIALCALFAGVAGFSPSVLRAVFMQSATLLAPLLGREDDKPTTLSAALMLLLLANPYAAASVGLQLSFAAVAGIYLFTGRLYGAWTARLPRRPEGWPAKLGCKAARFLLGTLATTLGALVFTTPLTACYFQMLSLIAPLANLLTLWAVSDAFLGGLAVALLGIVSPALGTALGPVAALPARFVLWLTPRLSRFPFAAVPLHALYLRLWLVLTYVVLLLYLLWRGEKKRPIVPICGCGAALAVALLCTAASLTGGSLTVSVLDVGQGQSVCFRSEGRTILVDCGGNGFSNAGDTAADAIQSTGAGWLDLLVLTHCHADHAGGVPALLERVEVGALILPATEPDDPLRREILALAAEKGVEIRVLEADARVKFGAATLALYAPLGDGGANEEGLSVLCTSGDFDVLVTGDMNQTVEKRLLKYEELPDIEVLVAGHHGSKYASSAELLAATTPEYAVISCGYNSYGHPAPETVARLDSAGCAIYRTDLMGTVTMTKD